MTIHAPETGTTGESTPFHAGAWLGPDLELVAPLACGNTSRVWVALETLLDDQTRLVAVKHVRSEDLDPDRRASLHELLHREGWLGRHLRHPNVVPVERIGRVGAEPYLVMPLVRGATLASVLRHKRLLREAVVRRIALELAKALEALQGLRGDDGAEVELHHRDVSPANVVVTLQGEVRMLDLGAPKDAADPEASTVRTNHRYGSPEQLRGEPRAPTSEVYSLGAIVHEALSGERLFARASLVELAERREGRGELAERQESATASIRALIEQCTHPDPRLRPSPTEIIDFLERGGPVADQRTLAALARRTARAPRGAPSDAIARSDEITERMSASAFDSSPASSCDSSSASRPRPPETHPVSATADPYLPPFEVDDPWDVRTEYSPRPTSRHETTDEPTLLIQPRHVAGSARVIIVGLLVLLGGVAIGLLSH